MAALRAELEGRLAEQTKKLTAAQDMLRGAATHTAELEEALEVIHCFCLHHSACMMKPGSPICSTQRELCSSAHT